MENKFIEMLKPGLYDASNNMVASWDDLIKTYGMDVEKDYGSDPYFGEDSLPCNILCNDELDAGVTLVLSENTTRIGDFAFACCIGLENIIIPDSVISIGKNAFQYCVLLHNVRISANVQSISSQAFYCCDNLQNIEVYANTENVDDCILTDGVIKAVFMNRNGWSAKLLANPLNSIPDKSNKIKNDQYFQENLFDIME